MCASVVVVVVVVVFVVVCFFVFFFVFFCFLFFFHTSMKPWGENLIILVIYFTYPVNPFIARSCISQLREFP